MNLLFVVIVTQSCTLKEQLINLSAVESLIAFSKSVENESNHAKEFKTEIRVRKYMRVQAKTIIRKKQLIPTESENEYLYKHYNPKLGYARINIVSKSCTCHKYFDKGVCKHLIAACILPQSNLPSLVQLPKQFQIIRRKKKRQYRTIVAMNNKWLKKVK